MVKLLIYVKCNYNRNYFVRNILNEIKIIVQKRNNMNYWWRLFEENENATRIIKINYTRYFLIFVFSYCLTVLTCRTAATISNLWAGRVATPVVDPLATVDSRSRVFTRWRHCARPSNTELFGLTSLTTRNRRSSISVQSVLHAFSLQPMLLSSASFSSTICFFPW